MKKSQINIGVVGANGLPASYGGWDQLLLHFAKANNPRYKYTIFSSVKTATLGEKTYLNANIEVVNLDANGIQSIPYDIVSLWRARRCCDVVIMLGTSGAIFLPIMRILGVPVILNIDGAEWKRGKWGIGIKSFLWLSEAIGVIFSNRVVADNEEIQSYVRKKYSKKSEMIAYGGDHVTSAEYNPALLNAQNIEKESYAFKVCRIEPENNIEIILAAALKSSINIVIVGNFKNSTYGLKLRANYGHRNGIFLLDPIYNQDKLNSLRSNAGLYVHGHSVGGTNPSLVEAMSLGLNCVVYDVIYNRFTTEDAASYFNSEDELVTIFNEFIEGALPNNGEKMLQIAKKKFSWSRVILKYEAIIEELVAKR